MMRTSVAILTLIAASALTACGSGDSGNTQAAPSEQTKTDAQKSKANATAEEVAKEARGNVKCPAKVQTARAASAPVDDIVGVRPGMMFEEAANVVLCTHDLLVVVNDDAARRFDIQTYGQTIRHGFEARFAKERVQKTSKEIMQEMQDRATARSTNRIVRDVQPGESKWHVGTIGMPGDERVVNAAREEWFPEGSQPPVAVVEKALHDKYGTPTRSVSDGNDWLTWAYDPLGRPITETSPLHAKCRFHPSPDSGVQLSPDCGITVAAIVYRLRENPDLAQSMQVGVVDQAQGYERVTATEQGLQKQETARRAKQVEDAAKSASAPKL